MKAIVFALSPTEGLWPVCTDIPAVSVPLLGRPLLDWTAQALKNAGVSELVLALPEGTVPPAQEVLPLSARFFPAETDTVHALLHCASDFAGEDFLALEGDVLWTPDLTQALASHRHSGLPATLVIPALEKPLPEAAGHVLPFPDPPRLNFPMAILSPAIVHSLADGEDLFRDALPRLARAGQAGQLTAQGIFHQLDSTAALIRMTSDLLAGKYSLNRPGALVRPGIWSASPIPDGVELVPPCWIGADVALGCNSLIGPHVSLEDGVTIGDHSLVQRSILQSDVRVGNRATVYGAVVCQGATLGNYSVLNEGAAVGAHAIVEDNVILMEGVGVGPGLLVSSSLRLTDSVTESPVMQAPPSSEPELSVEDMLLLGRRLGRCGTVGAGGAGFYGLLLARAFGCGAAAQGAAVIFHDGVRPDHAAWLARYYRWPASVFVDESGGVYLYDETGSSLTQPPPDGHAGEGSWDLLAGTASAYEAAQIREEQGDLPLACTAFHHKKSLNFL